MSEVSRRDEIQGDIVHVYDGIEEADNRLPKWWLWSFYLAIIFGAFYWFAYHTFAVADLPEEAYLKERAAELESGEEMTDERIVTASKQPAFVAEGRKVFEQVCVACHGSKGEGLSGPNLTDEFWKNDGSALGIYNTITNGVPGTAMVAQKALLGPTRITKAAAYVVSIRNTNVKGKAPEGKPYVEAAKVEKGDEGKPR